MNGIDLVFDAAIEQWGELVTVHGDAWAEEAITDIPYSPFPGRLSLAFTPWLREPLRAATSEDGVSLVVMLMAVQGGKTLVYDLATAYHSAHNKASILVVSDTDDNARDYAKTRLNLLFLANPALRGLLSSSHRKSTDLMHELTNGTQWWTVGAANKKNLQRRSIQIVIGDEVWLWPEGHMAEAAARTTRFVGSSKVVFGSQAGMIGSEFAAFWDQTDKREWCWRCPWCDEVQPWAWQMLEWDHTAKTEDGSPDYDAIRKTVYYKCRKCPATWPATEEIQKQFNAVSFWQSSREGAEPTKRGYHMTALPYMSAGDLACEFVAARVKFKQQNPEPFKIFCQKRLANFWDPIMGVNEEEQVEEADVAMFGEKSWPEMSWIRRHRKTFARSFVDTPGTDTAYYDYFPCAFLTVDVQKDCIWYVVRAWNKNGDSMLIDCGVRGKRADAVALQQSYKIPTRHVGIDSGFDALGVYKLCHKHNYVAMKGDAAKGWKHDTGRGSILRPYSPNKPGYIGGGANALLVSFSADFFKDIVHFGIIRTNKAAQAPPEQQRSAEFRPLWQVPKGVPDNYKLHLKAEKRFIDSLGRGYWRNVSNNPNHLLDCEVMNAAMAMRAGIPVAGR